MQALYKRNIEWEKLNGKSFLITGAYGMIASYVVFMLIFLNEYHNASIQIYALCRNKEKAMARFGNYFNKNYFHYVESDLLNGIPQDISVDYIIHAASFASSQFFGTDPVGTVQPNVFGTYGLLEYAKNKQVTSFLYVSSGEVYGSTDVEKVKEDHFGSSNPLDIRYCYGESKRMGECFCKCFSHQYQVPVKIVRLGHTYGPTMNLSTDKRVFAEFVSNVVAGNNIEIKSDGSPMRAFCYIVDAVAGFFTVLFKGINGEAYNIANFDGLISIRDLAKTLVELFPERVLEAKFVERDKNDNYIESSQKKHNVPDTGKLEALGWKCEYSVRDGFYRTIMSFLNRE